MYNFLKVGLETLHPLTPPSRPYRCQVSIKAMGRLTQGSQTPQRGLAL